jgi:hypothetical protein
MYALPLTKRTINQNESQFLDCCLVREIFFFKSLHFLVEDFIYLLILLVGPHTGSMEYRTCISFYSCGAAISCNVSVEEC